LNVADIERLLTSDLMRLLSVSQGVAKIPFSVKDDILQRKDFVAAS
jgi:hypothetical protein